MRIITYQCTIVEERANCLITCITHAILGLIMVRYTQMSTEIRYKIKFNKKNNIIKNIYLI